MGVVFYLFCLLFVFVRSDIELNIRALKSTEGLIDWVTVNELRVGRLIARLASFFSGFRIEVEPFKNGTLPKTFLLVANHQSLGDIPMLVYAFPRHALRFVTKKELGRGVPMISLDLRLGGHALVSRKGDYREGRRELVKLAHRSSMGICPAVFPEGTRSRTGALRTFHAGAFRILLENASLPVLSVAIDGAYPISRLTRIFTNLSKTRYRIKPLTLYPPPKGKREILDLLGRIRAEIQAQLKQWKKERE